MIRTEPSSTFPRSSYARRDSSTPSVNVFWEAENQALNHSTGFSGVLTMSENVYRKELNRMWVFQEVTTEMLFQNIHPPQNESWIPNFSGTLCESQCYSIVTEKIPWSSHDKLWNGEVVVVLSCEDDLDVMWIVPSCRDVRMVRNGVLVMWQLLHVPWMRWVDPFLSSPVGSADLPFWSSA